MLGNQGKYLKETEMKRKVDNFKILHSDAGSLIYSSHDLPNSFTRTELLTAAFHTNWRLAGAKVSLISSSSDKSEMSISSDMSKSSNKSSSTDANIPDSLFLNKELIINFFWPGILLEIIFLPAFWNDRTTIIQTKRPPTAIMYRKDDNIVSIPSYDSSLMSRMSNQRPHAMWLKDFYRQGTEYLSSCWPLWTRWLNRSLIGFLMYLTKLLATCMVSDCHSFSCILWRTHMTPDLWRTIHICTGTHLESVRWIQNPLDTPGSACLPPTRRIFFSWGVRWRKKPSGSACIDASRLIFQSAVSFGVVSGACGL